MKITKDTTEKLIIEYNPRKSIKIYIAIEFILIIHSLIFISTGYYACGLFIVTLLFAIHIISKIKFIHCIFDKRKNIVSINSKNILGQSNSKILKIEDVEEVELTNQKIIMCSIYKLDIKIRSSRSVSLTPGFIFFTEAPNNILIKVNDFFGFRTSIRDEKKYIDFRLIFLFLFSISVLIYSFSYPGKTLIDAVERGDIVAVREYLKNGSNPNPQNFMGYSPLFFAVAKSQGEIVELLLSKGAKVNIYCMNSTPLHRAVDANNLSIVKMLVEHRADINALNKDDKKTPLDYAMSLDDPSILSYLKAHGAVHSISFPSKR